jgi:hypothetical protein
MTKEMRTTPLSNVGLATLTQLFKSRVWKYHSSTTMRYEREERKYFRGLAKRTLQQYLPP